MIFDYKTNKDDCLRTLKCDRIVIAGEESCCVITMDGLKEILELKPTQEEADTKIVLHANHYMVSTLFHVTIYSPSGDTDIIVLAVSLLKEFKERVTIIDGHGKDKKHLELDVIELEEPFISGLIGFHALTGNDFVRFRRGKKRCFEVFEKKPNIHFGGTFELEQNIFQAIEEYICHLYGSKKKKVDKYDITCFTKNTVMRTKQLICQPYHHVSMY